MKTLYLMRHAKSSWKDPGLEDHQRPLNKRGRRDVPVMGRRLKERAIHLDRIVSSDARRAVNTAVPIGELLGLDAAAIRLEPLLYDASRDEILNIVMRLADGWNQVMIVGHNPGLHDVANLFYPPPLPKFPTSGIVTVVLDIDTWHGIDPKRVIHFDFDYPKNTM